MSAAMTVLLGVGLLVAGVLVVAAGVVLALAIFLAVTAWMDRHSEGNTDSDWGQS